jgi:glutamyl-tRNA(Gln) amidotransferase subunit E
MPNLITSDDEPMRDITAEDISKVRDRLKAGNNDAIVLVWGPKVDTGTAAKEVYIRSKEAFFGIPHETRQVQTIHTTTFERILPGPDRMYPDTDRPPITVTPEIVSNVKAQVPRPYWEEEGEMVQFGVPEKVAHKLVVSRWRDVYRNAMSAGAEPRFSSLFLMEDTKAIERSGVDLGKLDDNSFVDVLKLVSDNIITRKAAPVVLSWMADTDVTAEKAVEELELSRMDDEEARRTVDDIVSKNGDLLKLFREGRMNPLMGKVMTVIGKRFEGSRVKEHISSS